MTDRELMQQALEALENGKRVRNAEGGTKYQPSLEDKAITALRERLAQPEQEPVAWRFRSGTWFNREVQWRYIDTLDGAEGLRGLQPLYTAPRQWQGLTDEELREAYLAVSGNEWCLGGMSNAESFYEAIEAKLKEKNT